MLGRFFSLSCILLSSCLLVRDPGRLVFLRNMLLHSDQAILERAFTDPQDLKAAIPTALPNLLIKARPMHEVVKIDFFIVILPSSLLTGANHNIRFVRCFICQVKEKALKVIGIIAITRQNTVALCNRI